MHFARTATLLAALCAGCASHSPVESRALAAIDNPNCPPPQMFADEPIVASVGCLPITQTELHAALTRVVPADGIALSNRERREVLDRLIADKRLVLHAIETGQHWTLKSQKLFANTLLREQVYTQVRNEDFTEEDLRTYYVDNRSDFTVPLKRQVRALEIRETDDRTRDEARAHIEELREQLLVDLDSFSQVASEESDGPYRRRGGDMGFVSRQGKPGVPEQVTDAAFDVPLNTLSEPIRTPDGWYLVVAVNERPEVMRTFEQMRGAVLRKIKSERLKMLTDALQDDLRDDYEIAIDRAVLMAPIETIHRRGAMELPPEMDVQ